jgi:hypothetical protein
MFCADATAESTKSTNNNMLFAIFCIGFYNFGAKLQKSLEFRVECLEFFRIFAQILMI